MKKALITGITGQDGSYLAELLLDRGYEVHGIIRRASQINTQRLDHIYQDPHEADRRLVLHYGDVLDGSSTARILAQVRPDEIYNLAAQSHVGVSFEQPVYTGDVDALGTLRLLEAVRTVCPEARLYQASTSELFGRVAETPQNENTPLRPCSPYACAKLMAHWSTINYREGYGMFACNGILFNHESPRRDVRFVSRKISRAAACIRAGRQDLLYLGNLDARRDWGYAPEYVEAMWMMLNAGEPDDYVIATGQSHSVREYAELTFAIAGMAMHWEGEQEQERGVETATGRTVIQIDPRYFRPVEVPALQGDASKAERILGWRTHTAFEELVRILVEADIRCLEESDA